MSELNHVRRRFRKIEMKFEPADPTQPPATPGPLNIVRRPFRKYTMTFEPAAGFDLVLTLDGTADAGEVLTRARDLIAEFDRYARASGGSGMTLDASRSTAAPGTVTLRLVPADPGRGRRQAEVAGDEVRRVPGVSGVEVNETAA